MVSVTSARPSGGREEVPAKTTSSILPPRRGLTPCSPMTQERASTTFDLPEPFGPTTQVMPGSNRRVVAEAKDLNPFSVRLLRCMANDVTAPHRPNRPLNAVPGRRPGPSPAAGVRPYPDAPWAGEPTVNLAPNGSVISPVRP